MTDDNKKAEKRQAGELTSLEQQILPYLEQALQTHSQNEISKACEIPQPTLSNFIKGKRNLGGVSLAQLADYLGLELRPRPKRRKTQG